MNLNRTNIIYKVMKLLSKDVRTSNFAAKKVSKVSTIGSYISGETYLWSIRRFNLEKSTSLSLFRQLKYSGYNTNLVFSPDCAYLYEVSLFESGCGVSRSDVLMNPFIFLLTCNRPKQSFYINLESDYSN